LNHSFYFLILVCIKRAASSITSCNIVIVQPHYTLDNIKYDAPRIFSFRVHQIHRVIQHIPVKVRVSSIKSNRVLLDPSAYSTIIIPGTKTNKSGLVVIETSGKAKRLGPLVSVLQHLPELRVLNLLNHKAIGNV